MLEKENKPQASPDQGGMAVVIHDSSLVGDGTSGSPLTVNLAALNYVTPGNELVIHPLAQEVPGKQYQSFANAFAYLLGLPTPPDVHNRWAIRFSGTNVENLLIPEFVMIVGDGEFTSILGGQINFVGSGGNSAGNCIYNCAIANLAIDNHLLPVIPVTMTSQDIQNYTPYNAFYVFNATPISGTYSLVIDTHTYGFNWNDPILAIQATIRVDYPDAVVTQPSPNNFNIAFDGEPAPEGLPNGAILVVTATNINMLDFMLQPIQISNGWSAGTRQVQELDFSGIPSQGTWALQMTYGPNVYTSPTLNYNDDNATITTAVITLLSDVENGEGIDLGSATIYVQNTALDGSMLIAFINGTVEANLFTLDPASTIAFLTPITAFFERCVIYSATNAGNNQLLFKNGSVYGAYLVNAYVQCNNVEINPINADIVATNIYVYGGSITDKVNGNAHCKFDSPKLYNVATLDLSGVQWQNVSSISYPEIYNSQINGDLINSYSNPVYFLFSNCGFDTQQVLNTNTVYYTQNCVMAGGNPDVSGGGNWNNFGASFDPQGTTLISQDMNGALAELSKYSDKILSLQPNCNLAVPIGTNVVIYTPPVGLNCYVTKVMVIMTNVTGVLSSIPSFSVNDISGGGTIFRDTQLRMNTSGYYQRLDLEPVSDGSNVVLGGNTIALHCNTAGLTSGNYVATVLLFGVLIP